nr:sigma-70 family RNA polymerase sigma factor [Phycicoccus sp. HDW14]
MIRDPERQHQHHCVPPGGPRAALPRPPSDRRLRGALPERPPPLPRRRGRPDLRRDARAGRRRRVVRPRPRGAVRPLRRHPHQGRPARRAALDGLGVALGAHQGARAGRRARRAHRRARARAGRPRGRRPDGHDPRGGARGLALGAPLGRRAHRLPRRRRGRRHGPAPCRPHPEDVVVDNEREAYLTAAVESLPERLRTVVRAVFFEDRLLKDVAEELGVTESRVSQLRSEALVMLRDGMRATLEEERSAGAAAVAAAGAAARRRATYYADIAKRATVAQRGTLAPRPSAVRHAV